MKRASKTRFVFAGPPGAGKTTTANAICKMSSSGVLLVREAATCLLKQCKDEGKSEEESISEMKRKVKPLQHKDMQLECKGLEIFDRSLICSLVYSQHYDGSSPDFSAAGNEMRTRHFFSQHVFLFELGEEDEYKQVDDDGNMARFQGYREAKKLREKFRRGYEKAGFIVHSISWMDEKRRTNLVFRCLREVVATAKARRLTPLYPNFTLYRHFAAMNDEGGRMGDCVAAGRQLWTNLSIVLDRPYSDGVDYADIKRIKLAREYTFKESAILEFNERQVGLAYLMLMKYYITRARALVGKKPEEPVVIILHAFRQADGEGVLYHLDHLLDVGWPELEKISLPIDSDLKTEVFRRHVRQHNATLIFSRGKADKNPSISAYGHFKRSKLFAQADLILTFSVHVGLRPEWGPGTLLVPNQWTPIDVDTMIIGRSKAYGGGNHLQTSVDEIVHLMRSETAAVKRLQEKYHSQNPDKSNHTVVPLERGHFKTGQPFIELGGYIFTPDNAPRKYFQFDDDSV